MMSTPAERRQREAKYEVNIEQMIQELIQCVDGTTVDFGYLTRDGEARIRKVVKKWLR